jgi:membrane protease YdiL (CAAX protease family)
MREKSSAEGRTIQALLLWGAYALPNWLIYAYSDKAFYWLLPKLDSSWAFYGQALWLIQYMSVWAEKVWQAYAAALICFLLARNWGKHRSSFKKPGLRMWILIGAGVLLGSGYALASWGFEELMGLSRLAKLDGKKAMGAISGVSFFFTCIYAPVTEELFFRIILLNKLKRKRIKPISPLAIQAILFGFSHFYLNLEGKLWALLFGSMTGLAFLAFKCAYVPIAVHFAHNATAYAISIAAGRLDCPQGVRALFVLGAFMFAVAVFIYVLDIVKRLECAAAA